MSHDRSHALLPDIPLSTPPRARRVAARVSLTVALLVLSSGALHADVTISGFTLVNGTVGIVD